MKRILLSFAALLLFVFANAQTEQTEQTIQDTFLKMKLGQVYSTTTIKNNVGTRGTFMEVSSSTFYKTVEFIDFSFAGSTWNYAKFYLNNSGQLFEFEINNYYSSRSDALEEYNDLVNRMNQKYSSSYSEDEVNDKCVGYFGSNGIGSLVSMTHSKSVSGTHYYYVSLDYIDFDLYSDVNNAEDDEL
jgi:hypothetical protein